MFTATVAFRGIATNQARPCSSYCDDTKQSENSLGVQTNLEMHWGIGIECFSICDFARKLQTLLVERAPLQLQCADSFDGEKS